AGTLRRITGPIVALTLFSGVVGTAGLAVRRRPRLSLGARVRPVRIAGDGRWPIDQRGGSGAAREAAFGFAPGVEADLVVGGAKFQAGALVHDRLEDLVPAGRDLAQVIPGEYPAFDFRHGVEAGQEGDSVARDRPVARQVGGGGDVHVRARVAPLVHQVVDQAGVAAHGDPLARGVQIGL